MGKMNKMKEIADMLGVEIGERFCVCEKGISYVSKYYFDNDNFLRDDAGDIKNSNGLILFSILKGDAKIIKSKHTGFEHPGYDEVIYNINGSQYTSNERETLKPDEYSDKQIRDNWQRKQQIERRLYEAAAMLNSEPIDKENNEVKKCYIYWDVDFKQIKANWTTDMVDAAAYFESAEAARQAIDIVGKDDLIWLFRDFQPYIGAYKEKADA